MVYGCMDPENCRGGGLSLIPRYFLFIILSYYNNSLNLDSQGGLGVGAPPPNMCLLYLPSSSTQGTNNVPVIGTYVKNETLNQIKSFYNLKLL